MKTIADYRNEMIIETIKSEDGILTFERNSLLGMHMQTLFGQDHKKDASVNYMEEKIEVIVQMYKNGIDIWNDSYKMGSVSKAYYQYKLNGFDDYK